MLNKQSVVIFLVILLQIIIVSLEAMSARGAKLVLLCADVFMLILLIIVLFIS